MQYKKISMDSLNEFRKLLVLSKLDNLLQYYDDNILCTWKDSITDIKKVIYNDMKRYTPGTEENKKRYQLYQDLKNGIIDKDKATKKFLEM
jgi:hypothetical protein